MQNAMCPASPMSVSGVLGGPCSTSCTAFPYNSSLAPSVPATAHPCKLQVAGANAGHPMVHPTLSSVFFVPALHKFMSSESTMNRWEGGLGKVPHSTNAMSSPKHAQKAQGQADRGQDAQGMQRMSRGMGGGVLRPSNYKPGWPTAQRRTQNVRT